METILVNTSVWINFFKDTETPACKYLGENFTSIVIATCPTIIQEILQGVASDREKQVVALYFDNLTKLIEEPYHMAEKLPNFTGILEKKV